MLTLGVETSTGAGTLALLEGDKCLAEQTLDRAGRRHAQTLVAEASELFRRFELRPADCRAVAVSIGPGSFTGLRVGVVFAKTFAYVTGCAVAAVNTFLAIAENAPDGFDSLHVVEDAQRGELFAGEFHRTAEGRWEPAGSIIIVPADAWFDARTGADVLTGPGLKKLDRPVRCRTLGQESWMPRAEVVARLGRERIESGHADDLWTLEPFYLRKSAAEEKRDAETAVVQSATC